MNRQCGDCQLCCRLLPVKALNKPQNTRCKAQSHGKGCKIYRTKEMPIECRAWNCRWLTLDDTGDLSRPDHVGYVIDVMPDFVKITDNETGKKENRQVVQIWLDPKRPNAHRDPRLLNYLARRAAEGISALCRTGPTHAFLLFLDRDGIWHEVHSAISGPEHSVHDIVEALGPEYVAVDLSKALR